MTIQTGSSLTDLAEAASGLEPDLESAKTPIAGVAPVAAVELLPAQQQQEQTRDKQALNTHASPAISTSKAKSKKRKERTKDDDDNDDEQEEQAAPSSKRAKTTRIPRAQYSVEEREWLMSAWSSNRGARRYKDWNQVAEAFNLRFPPKEPGGERTAAGLSTSYYRSSDNEMTTKFSDI